MSQTYFRKLDAQEKESRLSLFGSLKGKITVWIKGKSDKHQFDVISYNKDRQELVLDSKDNIFPSGSTLLCSFDIRGMTFFSQVGVLRSVNDFLVLHFANDVFKSERRSSFRLLTYPIYDVSADFDLGEVYEGGQVIDLKSRSNQTDLFKNFLQLIDPIEPDRANHLKLRIQDLSVTGMSIHVGELEVKYFYKDLEFKKVNVTFSDDVIQIPRVRVVYVVDYIGGDQNIKKYKVGLHFDDLPMNIDDRLSKKINSLLREIDFNKDFENFIK